MNVQKGKHQVGQAPGYHPQQRFPHGLFRSTINHGPAENQSFHVSTGGAFPGQSAGVPGAGAGPGSQQIRALPMAPLPPPTQQAPHPQPPPTPTSTPPASDMGKPSQIPQNNMNMTFVQNTQRTQNNQQYYSPRISPPTNPRMATATARGQVINIQNLSIPYSGGGGNLVNVAMHHPSFVMAPLQQMQPSQFQPTRQHAPANHQYYQQVAPTAGILHHAYQSVLQPSSAPYYSTSPNFYMQQSGNAGQYAGNVPLQRFGNANQTLPPAQAGPQPGVGMHTQQQTIVSQQPPQQQTTQRSQKKRDKAIPIIDPVSGKDVLEEYVDNSSKSNSSIKSTHSNESSARETPLPGGASHENDLHASSEQQQVRAKFAAMVAAVATTDPEQTSSQQSIPEVVNGPEISEPEITQTVPSSDSVKSSKLSSNVEEFTSMSQSSDIVKESTGHSAGPPMHSHGQTMQTPVVSALTGGEVQPNWQTNHGREQFPALKTAPPPTVSINTVSPVKNNTRKQTRVNSESEKIPQPSLEKPSQQPPPHSQPPPQPQQTPQVVSSATTINPVNAPAERDPAAAPTAVLVPGQKKEKNAPSKPVPSNVNKEDVPVTNQHPPSKERREKGQRAVVKETPPQAQQQPPQPVEPTPQPQHQPHKLSFTESISIKSINQSSLSMSSIPALSQTTVTPSTNTVPTPAPVAEEKPAPAPVQPAQQTNGETPVESSDGKASQRQGHKKNKKMKDNINRKGVEKEGTEMDAFTDSNPEEKEKSTPTIPATINNPLPLSNKTAVNEKITKDELEDKIVAAKNEENAKVSALPKTEEDVSPAPIIEKSQPTPQQSIMLKHKYQDDQWSPVNPDGKKKYGRDFLLDLQNEPQSMKKPVNLPNLEVVLQDHTNRRIGSQSFSNYSSSSRGGHDFIPPFLKSGGGSISRGGQIPNRKSQQGTKGGKGSSKAGVMHISLSLKDDVKLRETENAWKPARFSSKDMTEEDKKTQELYKKMRSILNKLTPQKFHTLVNQVKALPIDTIERLRGVIDLVFDKAIDEPGFAKAYAEMCKVVANKEVLISREDNSSNENSENENNAKKGSGNAVGFRKLLLTRCQHEFERNKIAELNSEKRLQEIKVCTDPEKKKELQLNYEEEERQVRRKSVGNTKFIGELYILGMLTGPIMHRCIRQLLKTHEEEPLECLCKLLTTIGKDLEQEKTGNLPPLEPYFDKMKDLAQKRENSKISSRVRFMLQDVIELRQNKWVPRRDDNNPKTIDQIQRDADRESLEMSLALNSAPRKQDARFNDNDRKGRNSRGGNMNQNDDGWTSVQSNKGFRPSHSYQIEAARFHSFKQQPETTNTLGSGSQFTVWSRGAKTNQISAENKPDNRICGNNMYSLLKIDNSKDREGDKKHSNFMSSRSGKITPSPSIEKERMISGFKEAMDSDRQSHRIQQSSQPPSRDRTPTPARVNPASVPSTPAPATLPPLTTEEIQRKAKLIIEEYMCNNNYEETQQNLEDLLGRNVNEVLLEMLLLSVNISPNNASGRTSVGKLFAHLIGNQFLLQPSVVSVFEKLCEQIINDDIEVDVPHIWKFFAELVAPLISSEKFSFNDLHKICTPLDGNCKGILLPLFQILNQECGETVVRNKWTASRLQISDFCDASNPAVQKATEFLTRRGDSSSPVIPSPSLSMEEIEKKLTNLLQNDKEYEDIVKWVNAHVGSKREKDPQFIRALMTAICESSINANKKLLEQSFSKNTKLISRYVDSIEELEIQCLCAIQTYTTKLEHPSGLLLKIFNYLWENGKISNDAFIKWRDSDTLEAGKGVAVKSLTSFFTALTEGEISDEAS